MNNNNLNNKEVNKEIKKFVCVPNKWWDIENGSSFAGRLNHKRFFLWFLLQVYQTERNMTPIVTIQIKAISQKYNFITGFKKPTNIRKMLIDLRDVDLIKCNELNDKTKSVDLLEIEILKPKELENIKDGFQRMSVELFHDNIKKIKSQGFVAYCFLYKYHNESLGGQYGFAGYAEVDRTHIGKCIGFSDVKTVTKIIGLLRNTKSIVKIINSHQSEQINEFGEGDWVSHRYIIYPKFDTNNKYYISKRDSNAKS